MDTNKLNQIAKNTIVFLAIFIVINYGMKSCQNEQEQLAANSGNLVFTTTDIEYSTRQIVTIDLENNTKNKVVIENECPREPFKVLRYENNDWIQKKATPELDCSNAEDIELLPGEETKINYTNWNNALFSEKGRFRIELETTLNNELKTISTNEFIVVEPGILKQLWNGVFYRPMYNGLIYIAATLPGHGLGWAIILLTIIIRTILLVPSQKAMRSQKKMQEIQPRLEKIKQKYKGDQQKIAAETMAIWKDAKVNPMGSCLPMLLQFPFLIAIFYVVRNGLNPDSAHLLYQQYENFGLSDININFLGILDLTKTNLYVLPLVVGGLQFFQMKLTLAKKGKSKKGKGMAKEMAMASNMMSYVMPVMIAVFTASMPAGVGIYWGTSTIYGIVQQLFVNKSSSKTKEEVKVRVIEN